MSVRAEIGETEEGLGGGSSRKDLETMFQLIYLTFTAPRPDPVAFGVFKEQLKVALANQDALPDTAFEDALSAALTQNHLRARPMKAANVDEMNLDRSLAFYKERFADASDFTFVFVGSFDLAAMKRSWSATWPAFRLFIGTNRRRTSGSSSGHRRARGEKRHRAEGAR